MRSKVSRLADPSLPRLRDALSAIRTEAGRCCTAVERQLRNATDLLDWVKSDDTFSVDDANKMRALVHKLRTARAILESATSTYPLNKV